MLGVGRTGRTGQIGQASRRAAGAGAPPAAPVLSGTLSLDPISGEGAYASDVPARHFWSLTAPATTPTAAEIAAGTGAVDFGFFDATAGSINAVISFSLSAYVVNGVFSITARVMPNGAFSNVLRDTSVDVGTPPGGNLAFYSLTSGGSLIYIGAS